MHWGLEGQVPSEKQTWNSGGSWGQGGWDNCEQVKIKEEIMSSKMIGP